MATLLTNGLLVDWDPPRVEPGGLRIEAGKIVERGPAVAARPGDESVDCGGAAVLPGMVNGHTHVYSALAVGMPPPTGRAPRNFRDILELVWWRLDRALDEPAVEHSARVAALDALHCGATTLIDHHASPNCIAGSLDALERGLAEVGVRGVLCYETTDRNGVAGRAAGLAENRRYAQRCAARRDGQFAALVGAHASFTLNDDSLAALAELGQSLRLGVHIHVAEDPCDADDAAARGAGPLIDRLARFGLVGPGAIFAHGTHLSAADLERAAAAGVVFAHNPRSNMHNSVGYSPVAAAPGPAMLGTDGIGSDLFAEARTAWLIARHAQASMHPARIFALLAESARRAGEALGVPLGRLDAGHAADVVITDYVPATPMTAENLVGHLLFGLHSGHVRHVLADGDWALRDRRVTTCDEAALRRAAVGTARAMWERMSRLT